MGMVLRNVKPTDCSFQTFLHFRNRQKTLFSLITNYFNEQP